MKKEYSEINFVDRLYINNLNVHLYPNAQKCGYTFTIKVDRSRSAFIFYNYLIRICFSLLSSIFFLYRNTGPSIFTIRIKHSSISMID